MQMLQGVWADGAWGYNWNSFGIVAQGLLEHRAFQYCSSSVMVL